MSLSSDLALYPKIAKRKTAIINSLKKTVNSLRENVNSLVRITPQISLFTKQMRDSTTPNANLSAYNSTNEESTRITPLLSQNEIKLVILLLIPFEPYKKHKTKLQIREYTIPRMKPWLLIPIVGYS